MAYAAWHGWPSGALLPVYTRAMNPCQVGIGPMHLPNRVFAAFRWANRQRGKQARYAPFPSIWGLRHPVVLADTQQVARHQVVQPRSPLSSDMGSVTPMYSPLDEPIKRRMVRTAHAERAMCRCTLPICRALHALTSVLSSYCKIGQSQTAKCGRRYSGAPGSATRCRGW